MKRKTVKNAIATQPSNTRHSFTHQVIDGFVTAIRRSHDMQQMLDHYH